MKMSGIITLKASGLALLLFLFQSCTNMVTAQISAGAALSPVMKITGPDKDQSDPMKLTVLKIDIKVVGQVAVTTLDMTFYNSNSRVMEGEFLLPLGEGQTVSRFALDINGALREGVVVEKEKGRTTFEAVTRKGVDPGLLEMTTGNTFRARVYPLPARGSRRVVISYEQELADKGSTDLYTLPLMVTEPVDKFVVHAEVIKNKVAVASENELSNLSFSRWNDSFVADLENDNFTPDKQIVLAFPHTGREVKTFTAVKDISSDESYFYLCIRPEIITEKKPLPKTVTIFWDNSNSSLGRDIDKELSVLDGYIRQAGNLSIELVKFNIKTEKPETFTITNGNWARLRDTLKSFIYDGGTSIGAVDFSKCKSDEILLFSDGISDFGNAEPQFSSVPVYTINSNIIADHSFLTYIARRTGGVYINLNRNTSSEAIALLGNRNYQFISARLEEGEVKDIYPSMPTGFDNTFTMSGLMKGKSATLVLNFGFGSDIKYSKKVKISTDMADESGLLSRLWAEKKIAELSLNAERNKDEITSTGREYNIVTPNTSLIVLETLDDYLQYDIVSPAEMQNEFFGIKETKERNKSAEMLTHIDYVIKIAEEKSKWWNTHYPLTKKLQTDTVNMAPPPPPPPSSESEVAGYMIRRNESVARVRESAESDVIIVEEDRSYSPEAMSVEQDALNEQVVGSSPASAKAAISINAWDPQTPYLKVLEYSAKGGEYITYLRLKSEYGSTPSFYIDAADFFIRAGEKELAVKILSNLAELRLEEPQLLRVMGKKLLDMGRPDDAICVYQKVLKMKGEEPQSYLDLGLAYEAGGESQKALTTIWEVVKRTWDSRFPEIELIALNEINNLIALHPELDLSGTDKRLIRNEPVDIRVVLTWDTDNCDMDLWVTDPTGEKCFYQHTLTWLGGRISRDFTGGYGPEEYMIKNAVKGEYHVQVNYYGTNSQTVLAPVNLHLTFITNFGRPDQKQKEVTVRLEDKKDVIDIGSFSF